MYNLYNVYIYIYVYTHTYCAIYVIMCDIIVYYII